MILEGNTTNFPKEFEIVELDQEIHIGRISKPHLQTFRQSLSTRQRSTTTVKMRGEAFLICLAVAIWLNFCGRTDASSLHDLSADVESDFRRFSGSQPVAVDKALAARKYKLFL